MLYKRCFKCLKNKLIDQFYKHSAMKDADIYFRQILEGEK